MREVLCYLPVTFCQRLFWRRKLYCSNAATSPRYLVALLLRPGVGLVEVFTDPIELVSEPMKGLLVVLLDLLKKVLLVEDCLKALYCCANLLVEDPDNFLGRLLLEVWERAGSR